MTPRPPLDAKKFWFDEESADLACEFFATYLTHTKGQWRGDPFLLDDWQSEHIIRPLFGWKRRDGQGKKGQGVEATRAFRTTYVEIPRKAGKALALDTPLPTPTGWTTMGEVQIGDPVFDEEGRPCTVTAVSDIFVDHPCYRVTFSNGEQVIADEGHLWLTTARVNRIGDHSGRDIRRFRAPSLRIFHTGGARRWYAQLYNRQVHIGNVTKVPREKAEQIFHKLAEEDLQRYPLDIDYLTRIRTTQEIAETCRYGKRKDANHSLSMPQPLKLPEADLLIDPYVLGLWLGDGNSKAAILSCGAEDVEEVAQKILSCGYLVERRQDRTAWRLQIRASRCDVFGNTVAVTKNDENNLVLLLRRYGLIRNKHIPQEYLRASFEQRLALLQGLMDTDGHALKSGKGSEYATTSQSLAEGMAELLSSFGIKFSCRVKPLRCNGRPVPGVSYNFLFQVFADDLPIFRLQRKLSRMRRRRDNGVSPRSRTVQIVNVEPVESVPVRCITVDSPSHLYLFGKSMLPTHNSSLGAGIALLMLFVDKEKAAEVYSAAGDREQAAIIFEMAKTMVEANPKLRQRAEIYRRSIVVPATGSSYKVLSSDSDTKHGSSPSCILFDELHVQPDRHLYDTLTTGTGARRQPLLVALTTAGFDRNSLCYEVHDYACKVRDGIIDDPTFLPVIYAADLDTDDWADPETWKKAHPGLGTSVQMEFLEAEAQKAKEVPAFENTFKRLYLNVWTEQSVRWMPMDKWDECDFQQVTLEDLRGRDVYLGLDLSSTTDLTSVAIVAPPRTEEEPYQVLWEHFVPEDNMALRAKRDRVDYAQWVKDGYIQATPGTRVDQAFVEQRILTISEICQVREIAFDPWNSTAIVTRLQESGATCVQFRQGFFSMNAPVKELLALVLSQKINHGGNPVARWCMSNAVVKIDPAGNEKLDRAKSTEKIDACISLVMAIGRGMLHLQDSGSVYDTRGLLEL